MSTRQQQAEKAVARLVENPGSMLICEGCDCVIVGKRDASCPICNGYRYKDVDDATVIEHLRKIGSREPRSVYPHDMVA